MTRFPSAAHLASWAGMCPGTHESAGKHTSGKSRPGDPWLKNALGLAATAAAWLTELLQNGHRSGDVRSRGSGEHGGSHPAHRHRQHPAVRYSPEGRLKKLSKPGRCAGRRGGGKMGPCLSGTPMNL
ncbi:IS110 family transposase [Streptomyces sp. IB201691-2A2]|uniref:IS110 family transposase n=1 Tax=Streptomyces sp. IB201691-2A2 TaxID=2561920 RepID=UPI0021B11F4A|nr:IS110 family transposase [Streptomyces sp. IB201691-2A2]